MNLVVIPLPGRLTLKKVPPRSVTCRRRGRHPRGGVDMAKATCSIKGCDRAAVTRGWCFPHYRRWWEKGDPGTAEIQKRLPRLPAGASVEDRFWARVEKTRGCWWWHGTKRPDGYGLISINGRFQRAHRYAYELLVGPIPRGMHLDHLCRNPSCVNPAHLEAVSSRENSRRGMGGILKTHCIHGHEYTPENTYIMPKTGGRACRECQRQRSRETVRKQDGRRGKSVWRNAVLRRDGRVCASCGAADVPIHVDHILPVSTHPELRLDVSNGRVLCVSCHKATPTFSRKREAYT